MMDKRITGIFRGAGLYVSLAVCLAAVGIGGYFLLMDGTEEPVEAVAPSYEMVQDTGYDAKSEVMEAPIPVEEPVPAETVPASSVQSITQSAAQEEIIAEAPVISRTVVEPLSGEIVAVFSVDTLLYDPTLEDWRIHDGIDIAADTDTPVSAAADGIVTAVREDAMMGTTVIIEHDDGYQTTYANLRSGAEVMAGDRVSAGDVIGAVGDSAAAEAALGSHLHFSVSLDGDTVDPSVFLPS